MHGKRLLFLNGHPLFLALISPSLGSFAPFVCSVKFFHLLRLYFSLHGRGQLAVYKNTRSVFCRLALRLDFSLDAQVRWDLAFVNYVNLRKEKKETVESGVYFAFMQFYFLCS